MSDRCCVRVGTDSRTSVALLTSESSRTKAVVDKESERKGRQIQGGKAREKQWNERVYVCVCLCL